VSFLSLRTKRVLEWSPEHGSIDYSELRPVASCQ